MIKQGTDSLHEITKLVTKETAPEDFLSSLVLCLQ